MSQKSIIKGTIILSLTGIIAKFLGFFFRIPLIYLIGEEGIGIYQITYPLYTFLLAISSGVPIALSKMISERLAVNKNKEANIIFRSALLLMFLIGSLSSFILIFFAKDFIRIFNWNNKVYYSILAIALAPLFTTVLSAFRGYYQGIQNMFPAGLSQIIEQIVRVLIGVGLAYILLPYGIEFAASGASFGATMGSFIGLIFLIIYFNKSKIIYNKNECSKDFFSITAEIIKIGIPISIAQTIGSIMALIDSVLVVGLLKASGFDDVTATSLYGQLTGKAFVLINVPLTISVAIAQSTVPAISESYAVKSRIKLNRNINMAYKMAMILALPSCAGLYTLARPILSLIFQGLDGGWQVLQILSISAFFIILSQTSTSILNGLGKTYIPLFVMLIGSLLKIMFSYILIPTNLNILGAAYSTLIAYFAISLIDIILVIKYTNVIVNIREVVIYPLLSTLVMIFAVIFSYLELNKYIGADLTTVITIFIGGVIYFLMLHITDTFNFKDIVKLIKG
ncbi:putative polysaccharide biosynthesis protein [Caloramator australicus]|uniref:Stage V sporulation protein B n=1 Tax=Caloramator australicus RC3 TaxID=857293 RepID=I7KSS7_9CLOT|nr:polysaccharide biosynthesis protein [Caloramator australicus]CCJ32703.1 Stage V sporulation protein B [Caloramator australicus RC3]